MDQLSAKRTLITLQNTQKDFVNVRKLNISQMINTSTADKP